MKNKIKTFFKKIVDLIKKWSTPKPKVRYNQYIVIDNFEGNKYYLKEFYIKLFSDHILIFTTNKNEAMKIKSYVVADSMLSEIKKTTKGVEELKKLKYRIEEEKYIG